MEVTYLDLIVMRHGKAENMENSLDNSDFHRNLTPDGIRNIQNLATILKPLIDAQKYESIKIFSSSSLRTAQTAEIISKELNVSEVILDDNLYHGDYYSMLPKLLLDSNDNDCVIIIGHNPNVFFLTYNLCKLEFEFKKGSIACIRLNDNLSSGCLKYFINGDCIKKLIEPNLNESKIINIESNHNTFLGIDISDVKFEIDETINDFYSECEKFKTNSNDQEIIHQMRIYMRQLLTLLDFVKSDLSEESFKNVSKKIRSVNTELAIIRDLDQFINYVDKFDNCKHFKKMATSQRKNHETELLDKINSNTFCNLEQIFSELIWTNSDDKIKHVDAYIQDLLISIHKNKKQLNIEDYQKLHSIRIMGKKIKNMIEIFPDAIKNKTILIKDDINKFVKRLGKLNDFYNTSKLLDILYKLSIKQDISDFEFIETEYKCINEKIKKDSLKKIKKIKHKKMPGE